MHICIHTHAIPSPPAPHCIITSAIASPAPPQGNPATPPSGAASLCLPDYQGFLTPIIIQTPPSLIPHLLPRSSFS